MPSACKIQGMHWIFPCFLDSPDYSSATAELVAFKLVTRQHSTWLHLPYWLLPLPVGSLWTPSQTVNRLTSYYMPIHAKWRATTTITTRGLGYDCSSYVIIFFSCLAIDQLFFFLSPALQNYKLHFSLDTSRSILALMDVSYCLDLTMQVLAKLIAGLKPTGFCLYFNNLLTTEILRNTKEQKGKAHTCPAPRSEWTDWSWILES